ncbi:MAG: ribokinase [Promethearchaeota archaeon]|nr:MAG: ribokinase [Candidatus Lokiarchaeota archaeon]
MMRAPRLPIPGETVKGSMFKIGPGGKGSNQGVAAHRAGADTTMITKIGDDEFAPIALNSFKMEEMTTDYIFKDKNSSTGAALIMVDENTGQNKIIVTLGASDKITREEIDSAKDQIITADILLMQLETNMEALKHAISIANANGVPIILNPAPADILPDDILSKVDYLTPNESEASVLCRFPVETNEDLIKAGQYFLKKGVKNIIFTLGEKGAFLMNQSKQKMFSAFEVKVIDTTGAGDAFNGGLATALAEKMPLDQAVIFANAVGALNVTKIGTAPAMPFRKEINELIEKN